MPEIIAVSWYVFAIEVIIYAVGTTLQLLIMKNHSVDAYRQAASTDFLTGLLNHRAFLENALMFAREAEGSKPVNADHVRP